jgi:hypothetical protein
MGGRIGAKFASCRTVKQTCDIYDALLARARTLLAWGLGKGETPDKWVREYRKLADEKPLTLREANYAQAVEDLNKAIDRAEGLLQ